MASHLFHRTPAPKIIPRWASRPTPFCRVYILNLTKSNPYDRARDADFQECNLPSPVSADTAPADSLAQGAIPPQSNDDSRRTSASVPRIPRRRVTTPTAVFVLSDWYAATDVVTTCARCPTPASSSVAGSPRSSPFFQRRKPDLRGRACTQIIGQLQHDWPV